MKVGDVLCVYTAVDSVGRTSMKIHIEAWARRFQTHSREKVTDATFTFVGLAGTIVTGNLDHIALCIQQFKSQHDYRVFCYLHQISLINCSTSAACPRGLTP